MATLNFGIKFPNYGFGLRNVYVNKMPKEASLVKNYLILSLMIILCKKYTALQKK